MKKILAFVLTLVLALTFLPAVGLAGDREQLDRGYRTVQEEKETGYGRVNSSIAMRPKAGSENNLSAPLSRYGYMLFVAPEPFQVATSSMYFQVDLYDVNGLYFWLGVIDSSGNLVELLVDDQYIPYSNCSYYGYLVDYDRMPAGNYTVLAYLSTSYHSNYYFDTDGRTFVTQERDTIVPGGTWMIPANGSTVGAQFTAQVEAYDQSGISKVQYSLYNVAAGIGTAKWYDAKQTSSNGGYSVWDANINLRTEHANRSGQYLLTAYGWDSAGNQGTLFSRYINYVRDTKPPTATWMVPTSNTGVSSPLVIQAGGVSDTSGVASVQAAVYNKASGVDTAKWYSAKNTAAGVWDVTVDLKKDFLDRSGVYVINMYAADQEGNSGLLFSRTVNYRYWPNDKKAPTASWVMPAANTQVSASFIAQVGGVQDNISGVRAVQVGVYNKAQGTGTMKWYDAVNTAAGVWDVNVDIAKNHGNATGDYVLVFWGYDNAGNAAPMLQRTVRYERDTTSPTLSWVMPATNAQVGKQFTAQAGGVYDISGVRAVQVGVYNKAQGTGSIKWYDAKNTAAGVWDVNVDIAQNHGNAAGTYVLVFWGYDNAGNAAAMGQRTVIVQ